MRRRLVGHLGMFRLDSHGEILAFGLNFQFEQFQPLKRVGNISAGKGVAGGELVAQAAQKVRQCLRIQFSF